MSKQLERQMRQFCFGMLGSSRLLRAFPASIWNIWHLDLNCPEYLEAP